MLLRLLPLLLLLAGVAGADSLPVECSTPANTASNFTLTAFLPNAPCMIAETTLQWGQWGLWKAIARLGLALMFGMFIWKVVTNVLAGVPEKSVMPLLVSAGISLIVLPAVRGQGVIPEVQAQGMISLNALYSASASVGNRALSEGSTSVKAKTALLGQNIALLISRASYADTIRSKLDAVSAGSAPGDLSDPNLATKLYADQLDSDRNAAGSLFNPESSVFNIGFLVLYGLFAVFAALIAAVDIGVQLALLMLPVALAFIPTGQWTPAKVIGGTYLAGLLTVLVIPLIVATAAWIGLSVPADHLTPTVTGINTDITRNLTAYQTSLNAGCSFTDVSCTLDQRVILPMQADLASFKEVFTQVMLGVAAMLVGLGIAANLLRRPPAWISSMVGVSGGGESNGVNTGALSEGLRLMGGAVLMKQLTNGQNVAGKASGVGKGKTSNESSGASAGSGAGGGSGANIPPPGSASAGAGAGNPNVPPPSASGPSTGSSGGPSPVTPSSGGAAAQAPSSVSGQAYAAARQAGASPSGAHFTAARASACAALSAQGQRMASSASAAGQTVRARAGTAVWGTPEAAQRAGAAATDFRNAVSQERALAASTGPAPANASVNHDTAELYGKGEGTTASNARTVTARQAASGDTSSQARQVAQARNVRAAQVRARPVAAPAPEPVPLPAPVPAPAPARVADRSAGSAVPGVSVSQTTPPPPAPAPAPARVPTRPPERPPTYAAVAASRSDLPAPPPAWTQPAPAPARTAPAPDLEETP